MKKIIYIALIIGDLIFISACSKTYSCNNYQGVFPVFYNPEKQSCYYNFKGNKQELRKEQCAALCYED